MGLFLFFSPPRHPFLFRMLQYHCNGFVLLSDACVRFSTVCRDSVATIIFNFQFSLFNLDSPFRRPFGDPSATLRRNSRNHLIPSLLQFCPFNPFQPPVNQPYPFHFLHFSCPVCCNTIAAPKQSPYARAFPTPPSVHPGGILAAAIAHPIPAHLAPLAPLRPFTPLNPTSRVLPCHSNTKATVPKLSA